MFEHRVSARYARAMLLTALKEGIAEKLYEDFRTIDEAIEKSPELKNLTFSPIVHPWKKKAIYKDIFEDIISTVTLDYLLLLASKGRDNLIHSIMNEYGIQYNRHFKRLPVEIVSSSALDEESKLKIINRLTDWSQQTILPKYIVDPSVKGGVLIKIGDWVFDATIKAQLDLLYERLANA